MFSFTTRGAGIASAVVLAAVIGLAATAANAAPRVAFSQLVPAAPVTIAANETCGGVDAPARLTKAARADWPQIAVDEGAAAATSTVLLNLDARGALVDESVANTSGNRLMDREALRAVKASEYAPEVRNCGQIAGSYFINVLFVQTDDSSLNPMPLFGLPGGGSQVRIK